MKEVETFISIDSFREFYEGKCADFEIPFSEEGLEKFVYFCEVDFFDWLRSNWNYFEK